MTDRIRVEQRLRVQGDLTVTGPVAVESGLSLENTRITNVGNPIDATDVATRQYVDSVAEGLFFKEPVKVGTTADLDTVGNGTWVQSGVGIGATLTAGDPGATFLDGVVLFNGDRVLVKNQSDQSENGIYLVSDAGSSENTILTRTTDMDENNEFPATFVFVQEGTINASTGWVVLTPPDTVDTDPVIWAQFSGVPQLVGGNGIDVVGNQISVDIIPDTGLNFSSGNLQISGSFAGTGLTRTSGTLNVDASQTQITQLGTISIGTWEANPVQVAFGGTGGTTVSQARDNLGIGTLATQSANNVTITGGTIGNVVFSPAIPISSGGTGATTAAAARDNLVVVNRAGDTMTGSLFVGDGTNIPTIGIDGAIATNRKLAYFSEGSIRWEVLADETPETIASVAQFTKVANPDVLPTSHGFGTAFSPDSNHLAVAHLSSPFVTIYSRSGNTFTKVADPDVLPTGFGLGAAFSPAGDHLAIAHDTNPFVTIYSISGSTFTKVADPNILPAFQGTGAAFSQDGVHLAITNAATPFLIIYSRSGDTFTKIADPDVAPASTGRGAAFSPNGDHLAIAHVSTPFVTIYSRSGDTFTKVADPDVLPTGDGNGVSFSPDSSHLAVAHTNSPFVTIYSRSGNAFTKVADPDVLPAEAGLGASFSSDGLHLAISHDLTPFVTIYSISGSTFTKVMNPDVLPTGTGNGIRFSPDNIHLSVVHNNSPRVTIYEVPTTSPGDVGSDFVIKRYNDDGTFISEPIRIKRSTGQVTFGDGIQTTGQLTLGVPLAITSGGTGADIAVDARTNLGLGTISTQNANNVSITGGSITGITDLAIADGGTGASTAADARTNLGAVNIAGDTMTGDLTVGDGTGSFTINIDGAAGSDRSLQYQTSGSSRWQVTTNSESETGANAGSNLVIRRFDDSQILINEPVQINRATGQVTLQNGLSVLGTVLLDTALGVSFGGTGADNAADARTNLGLGDLSVLNSPLGIANGGTGASTAADARTNLGAVNIAGDTMTGDLTVGTGVGSFEISVDGAELTDRILSYRTAGVIRWSIVTDDADETGSNTGSDLVIRRYDDLGVIIDEPLTISRSTGDVTINNLDVQGTTTINGVLPITSGGTGADNAPDARFNLGLSRNWIGTLHDTAPNDTINTLQWSVFGASTNVNLALTPKGTGSLQAHVADSAITGGDIRGTNAVDWQTDRAAATQVASGGWSVVSGGLSNTASSTASVVSGGDVNISQGLSSTVGGGTSNDASGDRSVVSGGLSNTASGEISTIGGGDDNIASGFSATISGGQSALANKRGQWSYGADSFASPGDAQISTLLLRVMTSDATQTEIFLQGEPLERMVLSDSTTWAATVNVVARGATGAKNAMFARKLLIKRDTGAASTATIGPIQVIGSDIGSESGSPPTGWDVDIQADTTNGSLNVLVTGEAALTIRWMCKVELVEVSIA